MVVSRPRAEIQRYLPHAFIATALVAIVPLAIVFLLEVRGLIGSTLLSIALGMVLSAGAATLGSALWMRHAASDGIVFGDLMLWGWVRRSTRSPR